MSRIAVIGAGIGGMVLAQALAVRNDVVVFEKGRGVGGRMASRYAGKFVFDHGAQYFTARDKRFLDLLAPLMRANAVADWPGGIARIEDGKVWDVMPPRDAHLVGVPNMNALAKALAGNVSIQCGVEVAPVSRRASDGWRLLNTSLRPLGTFDWVVSTTTPHQTIALFGDLAPEDHALASSSMLPCHALMLGFEQAIVLPWVAARIAGSAIDWVGVNSSKPGRDQSVTTLVAHSTSQWAAAHIHLENTAIEALLLEAFRVATGIEPSNAAFVATHRWRSARLAGEQSAAPYVDSTNHLAATGDWTSGSRVENVVLSALELADMLA